MTALCVSPSCLQADETTTSVPRTTHPLMPGIRSESIWDTNWPRTLHDGLATGFSPLKCSMQRAPKVLCEIPASGSLNWVVIVQNAKREPGLLIDDGRLRLVDADGRVLWIQTSIGSILGTGDLCGDGNLCALGAAGNILCLMNLADGKICWRYSFDPGYVAVGGKVADILPDTPGLEALIIPTYGTEGCLLSLHPEEQPRIIWKQPVVDEGEFDERADHHGGTIELDFSQPEQPVFWNVRRFRCRGFDARTGRRLSSVSYDVGGEHRRNYGPMHLGRGTSGQRFACVFAEAVQVHVHAIRLNRDGNNELAWEHFYGEVYKDAPGVTVSSLGVTDLNGDGCDEMVYSVRDPQQDFRSFVRGRNIETGEITFELADQWGVALFSEIGDERVTGLLAIKATDGDTPDRGMLNVYRIDKGRGPLLAGMIPDAGPTGLLTIADATNTSTNLILRVTPKIGEPHVARYDFQKGALNRISISQSPLLTTSPILAELKRPDGPSRFVIRAGNELSCVLWNGDVDWSVPLQGGDVKISAADLDRDGRAEIVAADSDLRMKVYGINDRGNVCEKASFEHLVGWHLHHPVISDVEGNGELRILATGSDSAGKLVVRAHRMDGSIVWETSLPAVARDVRGAILVAGKFLRQNRTGIAVSMTDHRLIREGTTMLDGPTGRILWHKDRYRDGYITMPYRANGIPTAYDITGDGIEELGIDMMTYMAFLHGEDGRFAMIRPTANVTRQGNTYAGLLYNTNTPLFKTPTDHQPHWLVTAGFGTFGLMHPEPTTGTWKEDFGYDSPTNLGLIDVDGDGILDVGYAPQNQPDFICRDVWTGHVKWKFNLADHGNGFESTLAANSLRGTRHDKKYQHPNAAIITADFDGDGDGEFFNGRACIGTGNSDHGQLLWQSPRALTWPIVADFDGDGLGEIAGVCEGRIVVLKSSQ